MFVRVNLEVLTMAARHLISMRGAARGVQFKRGHAPGINIAYASVDF